MEWNTEQSHQARVQPSTGERVCYMPPCGEQQSMLGFAKGSEELPLSPATLWHWSPQLRREEEGREAGSGLLLQMES